MAFVAGASRGIGAGIARALAGAGASVAVAARTEAEGRVPGTIHTTAAAIERDGGTAFAVVCDVTDEDSVAGAIEATASRFGGIDVVICNAGVLWLAPTQETPLRRWEMALRVNLTGVFLVTRAALPHLLARGNGSLVAITTSGVNMVELGSNAYWVAKAGVERYYRGLATEMAPHNVAVNCLAPSKVVITEGWLAGGGGVELPEDMIEPVEDVSAAAVWLAAQDASGITGTVQYSQDLLAGR